MVREQTGRWCSHCDRKTLHQYETMSFVAGCFLSVLTLGLFLPFWGLAMLGDAFKLYRCQTCGTTNLPDWWTGLNQRYALYCARVPFLRRMLNVLLLVLTGGFLLLAAAAKSRDQSPLAMFCLVFAGAMFVMSFFARRVDE